MDTQLPPLNLSKATFTTRWICPRCWSLPEDPRVGRIAKMTGPMRVTLTPLALRPRTAHMTEGKFVEAAMRSTPSLEEISSSLGGA